MTAMSDSRKPMKNETLRHAGRWFTVWTWLLLACPGLLRADVGAGVRAFQEQRYQEALSHFQKALESDPQNAALHYNVAAALYKTEDFQGALEALKQAELTNDPQLLQKVLYNRGNVLYKLEKYKEAMAEYKKALDLQTADGDAKHNLELTRMRMQQQEEQQQDQQDQQQPEKTEPSAFALQIKKQAEALVARQLYPEAYQLMMQALQTDQTVGVFQQFIHRLENVAGIEEANR